MRAVFVSALLSVILSAFLSVIFMGSFLCFCFPPLNRSFYIVVTYFLPIFYGIRILFLLRPDSIRTSIQFLDHFGPFLTDIWIDHVFYVYVFWMIVLHGVCSLVVKTICNFIFKNFMRTDLIWPCFLCLCLLNDCTP